MQSRSASSLSLCWKKLCKQKAVQSYQTVTQNVVWGWQLVRWDVFSSTSSGGELYLPWPGVHPTEKSSSISCWKLERNSGKVLPELLLLLFHLFAMVMGVSESRVLCWLLPFMVDTQSSVWEVVLHWAGSSVICRSISTSESFQLVQKKAIITAVFTTTVSYAKLPLWYDAGGSSVC